MNKTAELLDENRLISEAVHPGKRPIRHQPSDFSIKSLLGCQEMERLLDCFLFNLTAEHFYSFKKQIPFCDTLSECCVT